VPGPTGPIGPTGPTGPIGPTGADSYVPGPAGAAGIFSPVRYTAGYWYGPTHYGGATHNSALTIGTLYAVPFWVSQTTTVDRIGVWSVEVTSTGFGRFGIYANATDRDYPGALVVDAGTVDMKTSVGEKSKIINVTLTPGLWWLACRAESSGFTVPRLSGSNPFVGGPTMASMIAGASAYLTETTANAPLLATYPPNGTLSAAGGIKVMVRVATP
jgi:hypothetical protein